LIRLAAYTDFVNFGKLVKVKSTSLLRWILEVVELTEPDRMFVVTDSPEDLEYVRRRAVENREEIPVSYSPLHTVHFDGPRDLARDRENTRILVPKGTVIPMINTKDVVEGVGEIEGIMKGIMKGREMYVGFYCYGPKNSPSTLYGVQVTDSAYVIHSSNVLYRLCYDVFTERESISYMRFLHSTGERDENGWSRNVHKRRIYIDVENQIVYTANTQYAGNAIGMKKLALRLCIYRGYRENWLCEHMFIAGMKGPGGRVTYFTGAFPAGCGKTATAMMADTLVGDDLAIIKNIGGEVRAVNPETGMFGIISGINPIDDPEIYEILTRRDTEVVFANVLLTKDGSIWWDGKPESPRPGINYAGSWWPGKKDEKGSEIPPSHPNARFTTSIRYLKNLDPGIDDPNGVPVKGMIFGGRDSDTWVPVEEAFDWDHGIVTKGAILESERTAAVLGEAGLVEFNPFAILDFLSISPGAFIELHFRFGEGLKERPRIFSVNYFLRGERGEYLTEKRDKYVWLKWMELRVHGDLDAIETPTGYIPVYEDLRNLFEKYLNKEFKEDLYEKLFSIRISKLLKKYERAWNIYATKVPDTPKKFYYIMIEQKRKLEEAESLFGAVVSPFKLDRR